MRHAVMRAALVGVVASFALAMVASPALAHQHRHVDGYDTTVGWQNEPAYAGFQNGVSFRVEKPAEHAPGDEHAEEEHAEGAPVENAELQVEVFFGTGEAGDTKVGPIALEPAFGDPGHYDTALIPTRPGTYTFHIFGTVDGKDFDQLYTSGEAGANDRSEGTYNDIQQPDDIEFPAKDPSAGELGDKVAAIQTDVDSASTKGLIALILGGVALLIGLGSFAAGRKSA